MHYTFFVNLSWKKAKLRSDKSLEVSWSESNSQKTTLTKTSRGTDYIISQKCPNQKSSEQKSDFS